MKKDKIVFKIDLITVSFLLFQLYRDHL
jgi:hypothetical protein